MMYTWLPVVSRYYTLTLTLTLTCLLSRLVYKNVTFIIPPDGNGLLSW